MSFYGAVVKPGKSTAYVPPPEEWVLHLSQAALAPTVKEGTRVALMVKHAEEEPTIICTLTAGRQDTAPLDLFFSRYCEFSVTPGAPVHISGYFSPPDEAGGPEDDEDDEYGIAHDGSMIGGEDEDEDDDEDEDGDDDDDEDEDDEDDEDEDGEDDEDVEEALRQIMAGKRGRSNKPQVTIEEITEDAVVAGSTKGKAAVAAGHSKAITIRTPSLVEEPVEENGGKDAEEDEEEEEDEEDEEDEEEEEEDEEEEAPAPAPGKKGQKAAAASAAAAATAGKRPAEAVTANGSKAAGPAAKKAKADADSAGPSSAAKEQQQEKKDKDTKQQQAQKDAKGKAPETPQNQKGAAGSAAATPGSSGAAQELKSGAKKNVRKWENGFEIEELALGPANGKLAKAGKRVLVRYVGRLKSNGKVFDKTTGKPFQFRLGVGEVIKGWDLGVEGMRVGDKRRLVIPPQLGYGAAGAKPAIPGNATLEFDVELVDVK